MPPVGCLFGMDQTSHHHAAHSLGSILIAPGRTAAQPTIETTLFNVKDRA